MICTRYPAHDFTQHTPLRHKKTGYLRGLRIGMLEGNTDEGYIALGTGIGNIRSIKSVAEVVNELAIC
ncbi:hypothetical protein E1676_00945 [Salmonella enterica subsp. enterica serovar Beaudesert]|nr:hypothetical protein [Salmonella enterica]ECF2427161.1 hypothetical protein [Salmonella enterica subsp. enterica serovar Beaudesert]EAY5154545.1 hypothetical protein [Salmonella enterica]EAZ4583429.1 hypothetical protein [Salmonella enterica]EBK4143299.1 hypothetical protein [Salmonella enterica]